MFKALISTTIAVLALSVGAATIVSAEDQEVVFPDPLPAYQPQPGFGTRVLKKFTYEFDNGTTVRPTAMPPSNIEDHQNSTYEFGFEITY